MQQTTIAAIATPPGEGALAVLRLSGPESGEILARVFKSRASAAEMPPRRACFGRIIEDGKAIDEVLVTRFAAPASHTGEDVVEITCHGGVLVTAKILELLLRHGATPAGPGEFTLRAFLNGKLDLTQAEAVMDLIRARSPRALRAAAEQLEGRIGREANAIRDALLRTVAHLEAYIDFPEEGIDSDTDFILLESMRQVRGRIVSLLDTADEGRVLREGVRLAIYGRPNAGKSSLLNRLLGYERAIVSALPGTTRDTIEEYATLHGIPFRIVDTAGIRQVTDSVESEGVTRARKAAAAADVLLVVLDASDPQPAPPLPESGEAVVLTVFNKTDIAPAAQPPNDAIPISCKTGAGLPELVDRLADIVGLRHLRAADSPAAINARHKACLSRALDSLDKAIHARQNGLEPELVAVDLRAAMDAAAEISGRIDTEDILGEIFASFCIGK